MTMDNQTVQDKRDNFLNNLEEYRKECTDLTINLKTICFRKKDAYLIQNPETNKYEALDLSPHSETQLLTLLKIPASYFNRCPGSLKAAQINYYTKTNKTVVLRKHSNKVRAIFSTRHSGENMDDHTVYPLIYDQLFALAKDGNFEKDLLIREAYKGSDISRLSVVFSSLTAEYKNINYYAGVEIVNSETGYSSLWVRPVIWTSFDEYKAMYRFIDRNAEGSVSIKHVGDLKETRLREAIIAAKEIAQIGILRLIEAENEIIDQVVKEIEGIGHLSDNIPMRLLKIVQEEYENIQKTTKIEIAKSILVAVQELPMFQRQLAEMDVGRYLDLFRDSKNRLNKIIELGLDKQQTNAA